MRFCNLKRGIFPVLANLLICLSLAANLNGQSGTTTVNGTVQDEQGNVVAGATVNLTSSDRGITRTATTGENGTFQFPSLLPGDYRLEIEAAGFKKTATEIKALVDTPANVTIPLSVGSVTETVTISSNTAEALLNTQDATLGNTIVSQQITQLPLEARDPRTLLTLQPGVTKEGYVAGARSDQSNITLDGVDINEAQTNDINTPVLRLNTEAVEEFRVTTTNANAAAGRSAGAQIALVTKTGTNDWRGAAFWSHRNTIFTANNFFNKLAGIDREKLLRNVYGGAIGGPIVKDRAFFFYNYEGRRDASEESVLQIVPLPTLGQGIVRFRNSAGNIVSLSPTQIAQIFPATGGVNPAAVQAIAAIAARYPANDFTIGDSTPGNLLNTAGFRFNAPIKRDNNSHIARLDFNLNSTQQLFVRGNYIYDLESRAPEFPDQPSPDLWNHPYGFVVGHTWSIKSNLINNFRYGLTRDAFTSQGNSDTNAITFRFIYEPVSTRTISRVTPVHNITNDLSWITGNHTFQFGTNIRLISNRRTSFAGAYDTATTNPSFYPSGGAILNNAINPYLNTNFGYSIAASSVSPVQNAVTAVLGRFTQYAANFTFLRDGTLQPAGTPSERDFRTQEYDFYVQDFWKLTPNLTITAGLRYGLSRPVYEANGYEVKPTIPLGELFRLRAEGAEAGVPYNEPIVLDLSGPANGKTPLYKWDKNNFQPRVSVAWSPKVEGGFLGWLLGENNESVIRGGFGVFNDYFGQALAVRFDLNNTLGFSSSSALRANVYNVTTNPGPLFTGFDQQVRPLPNVSLPTGALTFPRQAPIRAFPTGIEGGLDEDLVSPVNYNWNVTYERTIYKNTIVQFSYLGRKARNLLAARDVAAIANYRDPVSGVDWYTAATQLEIWRQEGRSVASIPQLPYFANVFPSSLGATYIGDASLNQTQAVYYAAQNFYGNDWTSVQLDLSLESTRFPGQHIFYQPQYGNYGAWSTIANSDYNAGSISVRQRFGDKLTFDINYTLSKSMDDASGLQSGAVTSGAGFILNPFRQEDNYAASNFDVRHILNANAVWQLPFGRGQRFLNGSGGFTNALFGGWQISTIFRYNSGLPVASPYDDARWATNWNVQSNATRTRDVQTCPTRGGDGAAPRLFGCNTLAVYRSFRNAYPGETGERNVFRLPAYWALDMGFGKTFNMPYSENHKLQFRWEIFNLTNTQHMGDVDLSRSGFGIGLDPANGGVPPTNWSNFVNIQGDRRVMQVLLRYSF